MSKRKKTRRPKHGRTSRKQVLAAPERQLPANDRMLRSTRWSFIIGSPVYLLFAIPDWLDYRDGRVIAIRAAAVGCFAALFALTYRPVGKRHPYVLAFLGFFIASLSLDAIMILMRDVGDSAEGFGLITFLFCLLVPATMMQSVVACAVYVGMYLAPALSAAVPHGKPNTGGILILVIGTAAGLIKTWLTRDKIVENRRMNESAARKRGLTNKD